MLAGIGGKTIEEAKERLTLKEAMLWATYLKKRGSLHMGMNLEKGFALLARRMDAFIGHKTEEDYMPHFDEPVAKLEDVLKLFGGVK